MSSALRLFDAPPPVAPGVPPWAAKGFRPFFLLAAAFAALIVPVWLLALAGVVRPDGYLDPMLWHAHEMVFGYTVAVIAGFLLTAVGNWTGRETATGTALIALGVVWLAGRVVFAVAGSLPAPAVAVIDLAFLPLLALVIGRALVGARSRRNYPVLAIVVALWLANLAIHLDVLGLAPDRLADAGLRWRATRTAVHLVILLVLIIAARVVPMFTRNATKIESIRGRPALDWATTGAMAGYLVAELIRPGHVAGAVLAGATAALALIRTATWGSLHTARHPLLWILHVGHAWIVVGLALRAASALTHAVPASSSLHALTVGGLGCVTLGMMARVSLGHSGRALAVRWPMTLAFAVLVVAAALRVLGPWLPHAYVPLLRAAGVLWTAAFAIFVAAYAKVLTTPRADGRPG